MAPLLAVGLVAAATTLAGADVSHTGCTAVNAGQTSEWCGLYPGNATDNVQELGLVSVSTDGMSLTVQVKDSATGVVPATSFVCLSPTPAAAVTHRLQRQLCSASGGTWFPIAGGSQTIDLSSYPQYQSTKLTVQVAANQDANNANGDAFYNNFTVDTTPGGIALA